MEGLDLLYSSFEKPKSSTARKLGYIREPGVINLSFSKLSKLYTCPRRFLIEELNHNTQVDTSFDMAYGSAFGAGVQELFRSGDLESAIVYAFATWDHDEFNSETRYKNDKWLWACLWSIEQFYETEFQSLIQDYELASVNGVEGIEPLVYVRFGSPGQKSSYAYQLHIDLILRNRHTGGLVIGEIKTSGMSQQEANWGNSDQTDGYYAILEYLAELHGEPFDPEIIYIVQQTGKQLKPDENFGFVTFRFSKSKNTSMDFIMRILSDIQTIELYLENEFFPKRGSSCVAWNRVCRHYGICDFESVLEKKNPEESAYETLPLEAADFIIDLSEMIASVA